MPDEEWLYMLEIADERFQLFSQTVLFGRPSIQQWMDDKPEGQVNPAQYQALLSRWMAPPVYLGEGGCLSSQKVECTNPSCFGRQVSWAWHDPTDNIVYFHVL